MQFTAQFESMIDEIVNLIECDYVGCDSVNIRDLLTIDSYVAYTLLSEQEQCDILDEICIRTGVTITDF